MDILLPALAEAILGALFGMLFEDAANRRLIQAWRERVQGPSAEQQAVERALGKAYGAFDREFPGLTSAFFDKRFLQQQAVVAELARLLTPKQQPDVAVIER